MTRSITIRNADSTPRIARVHITTSDNPAVQPGLYRTLAAADAMLDQAFATVPPPEGRPFCLVVFSVVWTDGQRIDERVYVTQQLVRDAEADGGLLRHALLRSARARASGTAFRAYAPTKAVDRLREEGRDLLRRMEADQAPDRGHRNVASSTWQGPTLLPDPAAAIRRLRERFAQRRPIVAAPLDRDDDGEPAGATAGYPATNHADVRYVSNYVSIALGNDLRTLGATAHGVIWNHWRSVVQTVQTLLRLGKDGDVYADNEGLWLRQLPTLVTLFDDANRDGGALRNARMTFRPVGARAEPYPAWVQDLRGRSGVYVIRERQEDDSTPIVYVGSSSADRLHETLTRHFQAWRRYKGFWRGQYAEGHDPGLTYDRDACEAAVVVTPARHALEMEARLIRRLRPRDNLLGQPAEETAADEVPF